MTLRRRFYPRPLVRCQFSSPACALRDKLCCRVRRLRCGGMGCGGSQFPRRSPGHKDLLHLSAANGNAVASTFTKLLQPNAIRVLGRSPNRDRVGATPSLAGAWRNHHHRRGDRDVRGAEIQARSESSHGVWVRQLCPSQLAQRSGGSSYRPCLQSGAGLTPAATAVRSRARYRVCGSRCVLSREAGLALPSDVVGGVLVALSWAAAVLAGLCVYDPRSLSSG